MEEKVIEHGLAIDSEATSEFMREKKKTVRKESIVKVKPVEHGQYHY